MYTIDKQFEFEYGHRVWTQTLYERFSLDNRCICRHLHGHHAIVKLHLAAKELTDGMVTDFKHLNCFKQFLDDVLDHRFIIDENDPLFLLDSAIINDYIDHGFYRTVDLSTLSIPETLPDEIKLSVVEKYDSFVIVDFIPTSENICKWLYDIANEMLDALNVYVSKVEFQETPKSHCSYEE